MRKRFGPMLRTANTGNDQPGFVSCSQDFILIHVAHHFDAIEASLFNGLRFLQHRAFEANCGPHDGFLKIWFQTSLVCPGMATWTIGAAVFQVSLSGTRLSCEFIAS